MNDIEVSQNQFLGKEIAFQDAGTGRVTDETDDMIHIVSAFFTGWMFKAEFWESLGVED